MEKIAIISSGCLVSSKYNVWSSEKLIVYASSLACYVLDAETFALEKVMPVADRTIIGIAVNPSRPMELMSIALDGYLNLWNMQDEECLYRVCLEPSAQQGETQRAAYVSPSKWTNSPNYLLAWDPFNADQCVVVITEAVSIRVVEWNTRKVEEPRIKSLFLMKNVNAGATTAQYNPHVRGQLVVGCTNGWVCVVLSCHETKLF